MNFEEYDQMMEDIAIEDEEQTESEKLGAKIDEAFEIMDTISAISEELKQLKAKLHRLRTVEIPELFFDSDITESGTEMGTAKLGIGVYGKLPKRPDLKEQALQIVIDNGGAELVKTEVIALFKKGEREKAELCRDTLKELGLIATVQTSIHHMTLQKWARELVKSGTDVDISKTGLYVSDTVDLKRKR